jgi:hypothetical protein
VLLSGLPILTASGPICGKARSFVGIEPPVVSTSFA